MQLWKNRSIFLGPQYHVKKLLKLKLAKFTINERTEHEHMVS